MRIEQLNYFLEVSKTRSINKAAENLFVTQPGLSDSIKKLESELGLTLLNRSKTGVTLTDQGKTVALHASIILSAYQDMLKDLSLIGETPEEEYQGTIVIATPPLFAASILSDVTGLFRQMYPKVNVRSFELSTADIKYWVKNRRAHLGFFSGNYPDSNPEDEQLTTTMLYEDELVVCLSRRSPLARHKSFSHSIINNANTVTFFTPETAALKNIVTLSNNIATQIDTILQSDAISPITKHSFHRCFASRKGLVYRPIVPKSTITFNMIHRTGAKLSPIVLAYIDILQKHITTVMAPYHEDL